MRRLIGDARWDALPERTRATRRAEGAAMVGELADLRAHAPWYPEDITVPVITSCGTRGAQHHQEGMARMAGQEAVVVLAELVARVARSVLVK